jgi:hypothetical protein
MAKQFILYNLKDDMREEDFVKWVHEFNGPLISGLSSVKSYSLLKTKSALESEEGPPRPIDPPYRIVGVMDVTRIEDYKKDQQTKAYKEDFMPKFSKWVKNVLIIGAEEFYHSEIDYSDQRIV